MPVIKLRLACSITPTLSHLTKSSRRLGMIKPKARLLLEQQRAKIIMTDTRRRSYVSPGGPICEDAIRKAWRSSSRSHVGRRSLSQ